MKIKMDKTLAFWIDCAVERERDKYPKVRRPELIARILTRWEVLGEAMRYRNHEGQVAWKSSPKMLEILNDAEAEAIADFQHEIEARAKPIRR